MTQRKQQKLRHLLDQWQPSRRFATARQVAELTGGLRHVPFALRPGKVFVVGRLLAAVDMPQSAAFPSGVANPLRRVTLGPMSHDDPKFWCWFVQMGLDGRGGDSSCPMDNILTLPRR